MLLDLQIRDFALIEQLHLQMQPGLTVISGETGAGKSIIVGALGLLLGGRGSADLIRTGADSATIEAAFALGAAADARAMLAAWDADPEDDTLVLRRTIARSGRNRIMINQRMATVQMLGQLAGRLVDISGQYSQQLLLQEDNHGEVLDAFAGVQDAVAEFRRRWDACHALQARVQQLRASAADVKQRVALLQFQCDELQAAALQPGECADLQREQQRLSHARILYETTYGAYRVLYEDEQSCLGTLQGVRRELDAAAAVDDALAPLTAGFNDALLGIDDLAQQLRRYADGVEIDPERLAEVEQRLDLLYRLERKYDMPADDLVAHAAQLAEELARIGGGDAAIADAEQQLRDQAAALWQAAAQLSQQRRTAAACLESLVVAELADVAMPQAVFEVRMETASPQADDALDGLTPAGADTVRFFISPNPGEEPKPLSRIASGGEISRIVLALKKILAAAYRVPTLLFDEVDAGIGGATADAVGRKLCDIADTHQVLCITHLPQIARFAAAHCTVTKREDAGRTVTEVATLDRAGRVEEIARMLGGARITETTRRHARELIRQDRGA